MFQRSRSIGSRMARRYFNNRLHAIRSHSSSMATLDNQAVNILRHSCRLQYFVSAPLVLCPQWRAICMARAGAHLIPVAEKQPQPPLPVEELGLYTWFRDEYIVYVKRSLFLFELAVVSGSTSITHSGNHPHTHPVQSHQPQHTQPVFLFHSSAGGLLLFQCDLRGVDLHLRLYTFEKPRATISAAARFAALVDRCRTMTHVHSFCFDQHVRIVQSWVLDDRSFLPASYDHAAIIRDLCAVYMRKPLFAASLVASGRTEITNLRFMTSQELVTRVKNSLSTQQGDQFQLSFRNFRAVNVSPRRDSQVEAILDQTKTEKKENGDTKITVPELVLVGKERSLLDIITTTIICTIRPAVRYQEDGSPTISDDVVEILFSVATTTKRWKELFPLDTQKLNIEEIMNSSAQKPRNINKELEQIALALDRYRPSPVDGEASATMNAAFFLRSIVLNSYRQGEPLDFFQRVKICKSCTH